MRDCFGATLRSLVADDCMVRTSHTDCEDDGAPCMRHLTQLPIYVLHARHAARHEFMSEQLAAIRAADVTWVICANAAEVWPLYECAAKRGLLLFTAR